MESVVKSNEPFDFNYFFNGNMNDVKKSGAYYIGSSADVQNIPPNTSWSIALVLGDSSNVIQVVFNANQYTSAANGVYVRRCTNGIWGSWYFAAASIVGG